MFTCSSVVDDVELYFVKHLQNHDSEVEIICVCLGFDTQSSASRDSTGLLSKYQHPVLLQLTSLSTVCYLSSMSNIMRKTAFCICKNKGADQLCSNCTADQHLCFAKWIA